WCVRAHRKLQLDLVGNDVSRDAAVDRPDSNHHRIDWVVFARYDGLQSKDNARGEHDWVDRLVWRRGVSTAAMHHNGYGIRHRAEISGMITDGAGRDRVVVMQR